MPAIQVTKTDTLEILRQKVNQLGESLFSISSGGSDLSAGNIKLGDGSRTEPSLAFVSETDLGLYKPQSKTLGIVSEGKKVTEFSNLGTYSFKDMVVQRRMLGSSQNAFGTISSGSNYDAGTYSNISLIGGTGTGGVATITVTEYQGTTNKGSGYKSGQYSNVNLTGGSGSGASVSFIVRGLTGTISNEGSGYTPGTYENVPLTGGSGSGAQATIFVASPGAGTPGGNITSVTITSSGNNAYNTGEILSVNNSSLGGTGSGFQFQIIAENPGKIEQLTFNDKGIGYQTNDVLSLPGTKTGVSTNLKGEVLNLSSTLSASSATVTVSSTTGIIAGMTVFTAQGDTGQLAFGTTVLSVNSSTQVTLSQNPTASGPATLTFRSSGTLTEITVSSTDGIFTGSIVTQTSGTGQLAANTTVSGINASTNVITLSATPTRAGTATLSFAPPYGTPVTNFSYTVGTLGTVDSYSITQSGNGYSVSDTLTINPSDLSKPITYYVKNIVVQKLYFTGLSSSAFNVGDKIKKIDGAVVNTTVSSSTAIPSQADQSYLNVTSTTNGSGEGAKFNVFRGTGGVISTVIVSGGNAGLKYKTGDLITIPGTQVGGTSPTDNIVLQVTSASVNIEYTVYKKVLNGSNIDYIVTESIQSDLFADGGIIVKNNNYTTTYTIGTASNWSFRYLIDLNDGNGYQLTPSWEVYVGDTYAFDLSDSSNTSHVFALSEYRDGIWGPSYIQNVSTTLSNISSSITVSSTTNILPGMNVTLVSGAGSLSSNTKVLSVPDSTTIILDKIPLQSGSAVLNFRGYSYTDGVSTGNSSLLLKVTENTPNLYYFCNFANIAHVDEGGEDFEEALITVNPNNPRSFGSGFSIVVNEVETDNVITLNIEEGSVTALQFNGDDTSFANSTVTGTLTATNISNTTLVTTAINGVGNLKINSPTIDVSGDFNVGTSLQILNSNGNLTTSGVLRTNGSLNINNILTITNSNIASSSGNDITLSPATGRVARVNSSSAFIIPSGSSAQRPTSGIVANGAIRFNTDNGQYEGYSASSNSWSSLGGVRDIDGNTYIIAEATTGANDNTLYFFNDNQNTLRLGTSFLDFRTVKKIRSYNTSAPNAVEWTSNTPVTTGVYLKYRNNIYEVTTAGTTAGPANPPTHTTGVTSNGTAQLTWSATAVAPLTFEEIEELRVGPLGNLPLVINSELRLASNVISTDVEDLIFRPNSGKKVTIDASSSLVIPAGDSNSRGVPLQGSIRYNTSITQFEGYNGSNWTSLGGVKDVDGNTYIIPETSPGSNENILYFYNDGNNTLRVSTTALDFRSISKITSQSESLDLDVNTLSFNNFAASLTTSGSSTFLSSTQTNFDIGLSVGITNNYLLRLNTSGDFIVNKGFGTSNIVPVKVLDNELKDFELDDTKLSTSDIILTKGTTNSGSNAIYSPSSACAARVIVSAHNTSTNDKEVIEFVVTDKGSDIFNTEIGNVRSGLAIINPSFDFDASSNVRLNVVLDSSVSASDVVNITIVKTIIKK